ncbi:uncharacterized protein LOC129771481 [Toxorhynchites rutilus septentrionalis]|uniref:uncharacterized protein LOC129771481 n=1 Tax=Toxorhynchites rutilus septentrionalis TaxID=329112 RepID=UPI00247ABCD8|nr:uncharacterized protein LOC129771481 [Toxorhynchites rutilus septentrionalis]XP_055631137.1 uncharacterized protein LOC129771481 [Toxorhynchites rutilus septentrionalis]XP_055631138.1 uncharacterized protein LOC129771481 [Toxorhynchites rutilus septentrionalis]
MEKYVTVVSVEDQPGEISGVDGGNGALRHVPDVDINKASEKAAVEVSTGSSGVVDSQFVTVLSINHGESMEVNEPELVLVYRLPGERLGFGLKFQGGTKNNEKIQRLFIQSCAENSPASRVQSSWGYLREGDEILEIDGVSVTLMTRIECVKCLKESNLAIKLLVRNGEGKVQNFYDDNGDLPEKKSAPPPPPPVPPRKLNKRKSIEHQSVEPPAKQIVEIVHPPDAEVYSNLFSEDFSDLISESDDTASTISTIIDKFSLCSSLSSEDYTISSNPTSLELAKALKPFTLLEQEFNLDNKLENSLFAFPPSTVNVVQLEVEAEPVSTEYENVTIAKVDENKNYENVVVHASDHQPANYENVTIQIVPDPQPYENVVFSSEDDSSGRQDYENISLQSPPPLPLPRQGPAVVETKKRAASVVSVIAPPRQKSPKLAQLGKIPSHAPNEFNTIHSWLQEATEVIHECALTPNVESPKEEKPPVRFGSNENLPRLIDFHPKVPGSFSPTASQLTTTIVTVATARNEEDDQQQQQVVPSGEDHDFPVAKKCIKITNANDGDDDDDEMMERYADSSSDEDEEKCYQPAQIEDDGQSCDTGTFDSYSDEDGEKLGPPEIVSGGPSEAYFNFHWTSTLLPPIGEVEEEFSSLENQQSGPIVIIDTAEETFFNDSNNNQHREPKPKFRGLQEYPSDDEEDAGAADHFGVSFAIRSTTPNQRPLTEPPPVPTRSCSIDSLDDPLLDDEHDEREDDEGTATGDGCPMEQETAVVVDDSGELQDIATDKHQVQPATGGDASVGATPTAAVETTTPSEQRDEQIVLIEEAECVKGVDQLQDGAVVDNENLDAPGGEKIGEMEIDSEFTELSAEVQTATGVENVEMTPIVDRDNTDQSEGKQIAEDICEDDVDILVVIGESVDSDFEELVKAQIEHIDDGDSSEQIQQIHERIIVGIERSSDPSSTGNDDEIGDQMVETVDAGEQQSVAKSLDEAPIDVPDVTIETTIAGEEQKAESNQESADSPPQAVTTATAKASSANGSSTTNNEANATSGVGNTVTIMDQMNNVVTTTTTATAIASTVHQQTTISTKTTGAVATTVYHKVAPPAFSRLPPDGHEFPPNFSEPTSNGSNGIGPAMTVINGTSVSPQITTAKGDKHSSYDDIPDLPKTHPPAVPRKVFRQDLVLKTLDQNQSPEAVTYKKPPMFPMRSNSVLNESSISEATRRRSFDIHEINKPPTRVTLLGSNWRKDEKSERSVRDKIAMFSKAETGGGGSEGEGSPVLRKFSKDFTKSTENLLGVESTYSRKAVDPIETYATLRKKAHSVENLDEVDGVQNGAEYRHTESRSYKSKFGLESSKPVVLGKAYSVENLNPFSGSHATSGEKKLDNGGLFGNPKILSRTTSFSGYSNGNSLATIGNNVEERRKSSITSLLEQRKRSMSKLRGLVIPERVPEAEDLPESKIIGLPIIKSKDSEKILSSNVLNKIPDNAFVRKSTPLLTPMKSNGNPLPPMGTPKSTPEVGGSYRSIFRNLSGASPKPEPKAEIEEHNHRRALPIVPPAKPPRTSLAYSPPNSLDQRSQTTEDESDDSDSVLSSRVSSPTVSPVVASSPEKYVLTRTLSSETNTSIASSNSTLTSSSGSQASCSSVGSTPAIDMSRRISKSSSSEMTMNRKNVLASAKSRSGRGDLKIEDVANGKAQRYEDGDSTDGYEEEERRKSKSKPRNSLTNGKSSANSYEEKELTHYKVVEAVESVVDKVIKVASFVEVVSDVEENASTEAEVIVPMQKPVDPVKEKISFKTPKSPSVEGGLTNTMTDLAKWVRHEAAKAIVNKDTELPARTEVKKYTRTISEPVTKVAEEFTTPVKRELRSSVDTKKLNLAEIRKSFEAKSNNSTVIPMPVKVVSKETPTHPAKSTPTATTGNNNNNSHDRFSSWDSLASSSSGVSSLQTASLLGNAVANCTGSSQTLQSTPSDYGSFSSLGSSHSLITPQDLQLIIEEADPPLATPEGFVIVLQRETPESSIGITLAGGSDYEAKEITIHKILNNSPAEKDGRLRRGDRILSINGLSMRGLTHRESLSVLKTPRPEVVMVITRSKSVVIDSANTLSKTKRPSLGSLSSLAEKNEIPDYERKIKIQHKASRSLDLDLDIVSNEAESVFDGTASEDGLLSADESKCSSTTPASDGIASPIAGSRLVEIQKDGAGLGFSIEGGFDSPTGNKPLLIKKIFMGGAAEKSGFLKAGEEIVAINDITIERMTRIQVWNMMKKLPNGSVRITLK